MRIQGYVLAYHLLAIHYIYASAIHVLDPAAIKVIAAMLFP